MRPLALHEFHRRFEPRFGRVNGFEVVIDYGHPRAEFEALRETAGILDLGFRSRLCLIGADRARFLHGQVTNDVKGLQPGQGCYAALVTAKGRMQSDLNIYCLTDELLLDFEPGLATAVSARLEKHVVADDVQIVDVADACGLLSVQGPAAEAVVRGLEWFEEIPAASHGSVRAATASPGEVYLMSQPRAGAAGFDLFVPAAALPAAAEKLLAAAAAPGARVCGWEALERARIQAGIPRYGADMDESHFPQECGIEQRAVSYTKGCYLGQEVLNRIHTMGHVNRLLRGVRLLGGPDTGAARGDKLLAAGKEVGSLTSVAVCPELDAPLALGYVRREASQPGTELVVRTGRGNAVARVEDLPPRVSSRSPSGNPPPGNLPDGPGRGGS